MKALRIMTAVVDFIDRRSNFTAILGLVALFVFYQTEAHNERQRADERIAQTEARLAQENAIADARLEQAFAEIRQAKADADARLVQRQKEMDERWAQESAIADARLERALAEAEWEREEARRSQVELEQARRDAKIEELKARADISNVHFQNARELHLELQKLYPDLDIMQELYGDNIPEDLADIAEEARKFSRKSE